MSAEKQLLKATIGEPDIEKAEYEIREPTEEELNEVIQHKIEEDGLSHEEAKKHVESFYYAVFPDYITGCPGYAGKVLVEIGTTGPGFLYIYTWDRGEIQRRNQAPEMRQ
ncbi:hypothetical protein SAMN05443574_103320 [Haloarcula vallismortis]|uniref:Uncharacterized protein n=2 Tax=Haloarcula vallismortis TaxID=28442 RepID=M0JR29_HALVA|nr:hypothetical protein [Haloarcula vallismortis]EMA11582.1 hypothetical protein C437_01680 [Haloarcula vallismortis ATCC 29715]SDW45478.1 hypothetical protein SAMN05443574_103320 [Haloarcula vallismortis]